MEDHDINVQQQNQDMTAQNQQAQSGNTAVTEQHNTETQVEREEESLTFVPAVDIIDSKTETRLLMDIPGVGKDGVDISIEQDILTIKAKPSSDQCIENCNLVYAEYRVGNYQRSFSLSEKVDKDHIKATVKDGVLEIVLPKMEPVSKKITVNAS